MYTGVSTPYERVCGALSGCFEFTRCAAERIFQVDRSPLLLHASSMKKSRTGRSMEPRPALAFPNLQAANPPERGSSERVQRPGAAPAKSLGGRTSRSRMLRRALRSTPSRGMPRHGGQVQIFSDAGTRSELKREFADPG